jgi:hypothetical protein
VCNVKECRIQGTADMSKTALMAKCALYCFLSHFSSPLSLSSFMPPHLRHFIFQTSRSSLRIKFSIYFFFVISSSMSYPIFFSFFLFYFFIIVIQFCIFKSPTHLSVINSSTSFSSLTSCNLLEAYHPP